MTEAATISEAKAASPDTRDDVESGRGVSLYIIAAVSAFIALVISVSAIAIYHARFSDQQKIGMVDIAGILEISEVVFTDMLAKPNLTDSDRNDAYDLVRETGPKLDAAIADLQAKCHCLLMTKAAVVGYGAIDYTSEIKTALGLHKVDVKAMQERIKASMLDKPAGKR